MLNRLQSSFIEIRNYLILYFTIAFSGIPFFDSNKEARMFFLIILSLLFIYNRKIVDIKFAILTVCFLMVVIFQSLLWEGNIFSTLTSISFIVLTPYLILKIVGPGFTKYVTNIIYVYAWISLFFWGLTNFLPDFHALTYNFALFLKPYTPWEYVESFILYTYEAAQEMGFYRNPGPFHEPGAFGVFLIFAFLLNTVKTNRLFNKKNLVFLIAAATTFSTATYLGFFIIFCGYTIFVNRKFIRLNFIIAPILIMLLFSLFSRLDFLSAKINKQYEEQSEESLTTPTSGRILGARKALVVISHYPLTGRGYLAITRPERESEEAAQYGWLFWVSQIGIPLGLLYLYYFYKSFLIICIRNDFNKKFAFISFISMLVVLIGQNHFSTNLFFMFFLLSFIYKLKQSENSFKPNLANVI